MWLLARFGAPPKHGVTASSEWRGNLRDRPGTGPAPSRSRGGRSDHTLPDVTSSPRRKRTGPAPAVAVRVALGVLGGAVAVGWLLLALVITAGQTQRSPGRPVAAPEQVRAAAAQEENSGTDLALPVIALGAALTVALYAYVRRTRRARTRTTPGGGTAGAAGPGALEERGRRLLVEADDCVRASAEELGFVEGQFGPAARPFAEAVEFARRELDVAFRLRRRLDDPSAPLSAEDRVAVLEELVSRCTEAGRRLDSETAAFDQLRALETEAPAALTHAESRFRELAGRIPEADAVLAGLRERWAATATEPVLGHPEQARDRMVFATFQLNRARQASDAGNAAEAAARLRAAEGAVCQAELFVGAVERRAAELAEADERLAEVLGQDATKGRDKDAAPVVRSVRKEVASGSYDPLDALRRLGRALPEGRGPLAEGTLLAARSAAAGAEDFVSTHRAAVGWEARVLLAGARHALELAAREPDRAGARGAGLFAAEARTTAERDVRAYGNPYSGPPADGLTGTLLGGVLLPDASGGLRGPVSFGGPTTRGRRATGTF